VWTNHGNLFSAPALPYIFAGQQQVTRFSLSKMVLDPLNQIIFEDNVEHCWIAGAKDAATSTTRLSPHFLTQRVVHRIQSVYGRIFQFPDPLKIGCPQIPLFTKIFIIIAIVWYFPFFSEPKPLLNS
jgi:hypothetical protein